MLLSARERSIDDKLFLRWICNYEHLSFAEFKEALQPKKESSKEDILSDVNNIIEMFNENGLAKVG